MCIRDSDCAARKQRARVPAGGNSENRCFGGGHRAEHGKKNQPDFHLVVKGFSGVRSVRTRRATEQMYADSPPSVRSRRRVSSMSSETVPSLRAPIFSRFRAGRRRATRGPRQCARARCGSGTISISGIFSFLRRTGCAREERLFVVTPPFRSPPPSAPAPPAPSSPPSASAGAASPASSPAAAASAAASSSP